MRPRAASGQTGDHVVQGRALQARPGTRLGGHLRIRIGPLKDERFAPLPSIWRSLISASVLGPPSEKNQAIEVPPTDDVLIAHEGQLRTTAPGYDMPFRAFLNEARPGKTVPRARIGGNRDEERFSENLFRAVPAFRTGTRQLSDAEHAVRLGRHHHSRDVSPLSIPRSPGRRNPAVCKHRFAHSGSFCILQYQPIPLRPA